MRTSSACWAMGGLLVASSSVFGQAQVPTTVQLPTFRFFTVQTSVSVPDGGGTYLGGMKSARDSSLTRGFGPFRNRGIGSDRGAAGMSVHATITDLKEMDDAILAEAAAGRPGAAAFDPDAARAELLSRHVGKTFTSASPAEASEPAPLPGSVAAIRAQNAAAAEARAAEAAQYFAKAQTAEGEGKPAVAKYYYQMVARRDKGALQQQALERIAAIDGAKGR
ncbi:MAG TPA: hypothetical protein VFV87_16440 [Pirellulaceae bacterium]|nr:hypothetical protein [Pirellulaceae bacterium]